MVAIYFSAIDWDIGTRWGNCAEAPFKTMSNIYDGAILQKPSIIFAKALHQSLWQCLSIAFKDVKEAPKGYWKIAYNFLDINF